jgi:hypothetical protein
MPQQGYLWLVADTTLLRGQMQAKVMLKIDIAKATEQGFE